MNCKIKNCDEPALHEKGRYARLCRVHLDEYLNKYVRGNVRKPPKLTETATRLITISERIDKSAADFRQAKNQLIVDINEFTKLLDALKEDVKKIVTANAN